MNFPTWVHHCPRGRKLPVAQVASNRLRFLILNAALTCGADGTISGFAKQSGEERARIYRYITRGSFPRKMAERIENQLGQGVICKEHLVTPLEIEVTE